MNHSGNWKQLSLSRLNHGQPGCRHARKLSGAAELHHEIADALLPQADPVFDDPTTLDAAVDMLDAQPPLVEHLVGFENFPNVARVLARFVARPAVEKGLATP